MPGSRGEVDTRVGFGAQTRFISGGASNQMWPSVGRCFVFLLTITRDPIYNIITVLLFYSIPFPLASA